MWGQVHLRQGYAGALISSGAAASEDEAEDKGQGSMGIAKFDAIASIFAMTPGRSESSEV